MYAKKSSLSSSSVITRIKGIREGRLLFVINLLHCKNDSIWIWNAVLNELAYCQTWTGSLNFICRIHTSAIINNDLEMTFPQIELISSTLISMKATSVNPVHTNRIPFQPLSYLPIILHHPPPRPRPVDWAKKNLLRSNKIRFNTDD